MLKRIFGLLLALALIVCMVPVSGLIAHAEETTETTEATEEATETTTESTEATEEATEPSTEEPTESTETTEPTEPEETGMRASDDCIGILKLEEGFSEKPYWDYTQYTVGFGSRCPDDMLAHYKENGITEEEAEDLLRNHLQKIEKDLNTFMEKWSLTWTQNQFDAVLLFSYNCGTGWCYNADGTFYQALAKSHTGNDLIRAFALWCSAGGEIQNYLLRRRLSEANMYLNGIYSQTPPTNYCYVLYDANGGVSSPRSQGYNAEWPVAPYPIPVYEGYIFDGWYTEKNGGEKVTILDASTKGMTFFAHWKDAEGNIKENNEPTVVVKVTGDSVNLRKGPGTNYTSIGKQAQKGEQLTITETATGSPSRWGKFTEHGGGWICLQYTNYDEALKALENGGATDPDPVDPPETTDPTEPTEPAEPTEPTEPDPTEPSEPEPTDPPAPPVQNEDPKPVMGTVMVNDFLRVRKGPSTGYEEVARLKANERVEILEQKVVGSTVWGRISSGWISLDYVKLDSDNSGNTGNAGNTETTTPAGKTGVIANCSEWVRIRSGAGTSYSIAGYYYPGDKVTITEEKTAGSIRWGKTEKGWVSMDYVKLDSTSGNTGNEGDTGNTGTATPAAKTGVIANCAEWVRIRSGAGTSYSIAGYYYPGDKVTITEEKTVGAIRWGRTDKGWVSMEYVKLDSTTGNTGNEGNTGNTGTATPATKTGIIANCNEWINIRSGAGTSYAIAGRYNVGEKVTITEEKNVGGIQWGKTEKGWVSMYYVKLDKTMEPTDKVTKTITADCLNVRNNPGTSGTTVVGYLYYGTTVEILETKTVDGVQWGRIVNGWISLDYAK